MNFPFVLCQQKKKGIPVINISGVSPQIRLGLFKSITYVLAFIKVYYWGGGVSLSKPNTSGTAAKMCVYICLSVVLLAAIYRKLVPLKVVLREHSLVTILSPTVLRECSLVNLPSRLFCPLLSFVNAHS